MTEENVLHLPSMLERLAITLRAYLTQEAANHEEWVAIQEGICLTLFAIRDKFDADVEFGQHCRDSGFGEDVIKHETRAAAISMGREPEALRACLEATTRRSLREIYRLEFSRFSSPAKPTKRRKKKPAPQLEKALAAVDDLQIGGDLITEKRVSEAAGVSSATAHIAIQMRREDVPAPAEPLKPAEMRQSMRKRYEATLRQARKELREEVTAEVTGEYDVYVRRLNERHIWAEHIIAGHQGVMSRDAFRKIKACLHPDHNTFKYAAEALQTFSELERVLVKPDEPAVSGPALPTTAAELMARRRQFQR